MVDMSHGLRFMCEKLMDRVNRRAKDRDSLFPALKVVMNPCQFSRVEDM